MKTNSQSRITRRGFIGAAGAATAFTIVSRHVLAASGETAPSDKLNIACVGVGGKGFDNLRSVKSENIVVLCDVDEKRAGNAHQLFPKAKKYSDYRLMLDKEEKNVDAVVVTTPDHVHMPASIRAMKMGKHVYCEKPLGHNVQEVRMVTELAKETGLATQLGVQNHASSRCRGIVELIKAGTIGPVKEVHVWCDNEWESPPRVAPVDSTLSPRDRRPQEIPPVPENLKWNLWLGPAPARPYHPAYHPISWRGWWEFGNGRLGDMGCPMLDLPFAALDLKHPLTVEARGPHRAGLERAPRWLTCKWTFAARGDQPPVELTWYDGNKRPESLENVKLPGSDYPWFIVFVGAEGMLISGISGTYKLYPEEKFTDVELPSLEHINHHQEWIAASKTGSPTGAHFGFGGPLTEMVLLGTVSYRVGQKLEWDPENLKATNAPEADQFIRREEYREGWTL